jgi:hypothetical protein
MNLYTIEAAGTGKQGHLSLIFHIYIKAPDGSWKDFCYKNQLEAPRGPLIVIKSSDASQGASHSSD